MRTAAHPLARCRASIQANLFDMRCLISSLRGDSHSLLSQSLGRRQLWRRRRRGRQRRCWERRRRGRQDYLVRSERDLSINPHEVSSSCDEYAYCRVHACAFIQEPLAKLEIPFEKFCICAEYLSMLVSEQLCARARSSTFATNITPQVITPRRLLPPLPPAGAPDTPSPTTRRSHSSDLLLIGGRRTCPVRRSQVIKSTQDARAPLCFKAVAASEVWGTPRTPGKRASLLSLLVRLWCGIKRPALACTSHAYPPPFCTPLLSRCLAQENTHTRTNTPPLFNPPVPHQVRPAR